MSDVGRRRLAAVLIAAAACGACGGSTGSAGATGGSTDGGGGGGPGADAGPDGTSATNAGIFPAFRPEMPLLQKGSLTPIDAPVVVPVYFADEASQTGIDGALSAWVASRYFLSSVGEYGVRSGSMGTSIALTESAPASPAFSDVEAWLASKLDGSHAEFGPVDAATLKEKIFVLFYPASTVVHAFDGSASCASWFSAHLGVTLASGAVASYVIAPRCPAAPGETELDTLTSPTTAMIVSAATDPIPSSTPKTWGWANFDADHAAFATPGPEVGTACSAYKGIKPPGLDVTIARTWSNAAAAQYHEPCVPAKDTQPYFVAAAAATDDVKLGSDTTKGVKVAAGASAKIPLELFSDAATSGPWTVTATSFDPAYGVSLDRSSGSNGDVLQLTVTNSGASSAPAVLQLDSHLGTRHVVWFVVTGPS